MSAKRNVVNGYSLEDFTSPLEFCFLHPTPLTPMPITYYVYHPLLPFTATNAYRQTALIPSRRACCVYFFPQVTCFKTSCFCYYNGVVTTLGLVDAATDDNGAMKCSLGVT